MTTWQLLSSTWTWQPSVLVGCAALFATYLLAFRATTAWPPAPGKISLFLLADLALLVALVSPLDVLGDDYLFSAHMLQHLLLLLVTPPLLILSLPAALQHRALAYPVLGRAAHILGHPVLAWIAYIGFVWAWHVPALYNAALADENVHLVEHLCFLVGATLFWWPVLAPAAEARLAPIPAIFYLFFGMVAQALLGIWLTFTPVGLYPTYLHPDDALGILPLLRNGWGLTPSADQQLAGLMMWVPGGLVYLPAIFGALARWYALPEDEDQEPVAAPKTA
jgi:putative membrane protein